MQLITQIAVVQLLGDNKMIPQYLLKAKNEIQWIETKSEKPEKLKSERAIIHFISTNDLDRQRDIMIPSGMVDKDFSQSPSVWYNHNYNYDPNALPVAKSQWRKKQESGILAKTEFATTEFADDVYTLHEGEFMNTWSIGFRPLKDKVGIVEKDSITFDEKKNITTYHKWELLEYSSAPIAANVNATDQIKALSEIKFKSREMIEMIKSVKSEADMQMQMNDMQSQIDKMKTMCEEDMVKMDEMGKKMEEMMSRMDGCEEDIMKLMDEMKNHKNLMINRITRNISTELPASPILTDDKIKSLVQRIVGGGK